LQTLFSLNRVTVALSDGHHNLSCILAAKKMDRSSVCLTIKPQTALNVL
jgi:hypothetical protein